jgi:hypothetical protein
MSAAIMIQIRAGAVLAAIIGLANNAMAGGGEAQCGRPRKAQQRK